MISAPHVILALSVLFSGITLFAQETTTRPPRQYVTVTYPPLSEAVVPMIGLSTPEGQALLGPDEVDYETLAPSWVAQYKSHCGAASAVVVVNALKPEMNLDQDDLFVPETAHIITQDVVYRMGFTLEELTNMIATRSGLPATRFHAGDGESEYSYEAFLDALRRNRESPGDQIIINYATGWVINRTNTGGHFSPIVAYHEAEDLVLVLEVNPARESFWVKSRELYDAMNKVDRVSSRVRGWIVVGAAE